MENNRSSKVIALVGLVAGIVGISLGFAAFSNTLTISSSATVTPNANTFDVNLSATAASTTTTDVEGVKTPTYDSQTNPYDYEHFTAGNARITNMTAAAGSSSNAKIENLVANFTAPGQTVTYTFYARNEGEYIAYLNGVTMNATGVCTPSDVEPIPTTTQMNTACNAINIKVSVGGQQFTEAKADKETETTGHSLAVGANEPIVVTISYPAGTTADVNRVDGAFSVRFSDIVLTYGSVD